MSSNWLTAFVAGATVLAFLIMAFSRTPTRTPPPRTGFLQLGLSLLIGGALVIWAVVAQLVPWWAAVLYFGIDASAFALLYTRRRRGKASEVAGRTDPHG